MKAPVYIKRGAAWEACLSETSVTDGIVNTIAKTYGYNVGGRKSILAKDAHPRDTIKQASNCGEAFLVAQSHGKPGYLYLTTIAGVEVCLLILALHRPRPTVAVVFQKFDADLFRGTLIKCEVGEDAIYADDIVVVGGVRLRCTAIQRRCALEQVLEEKYSPEQMIGSVIYLKKMFPATKEGVSEAMEFAKITRSRGVCLRSIGGTKDLFYPVSTSSDYDADRQTSMSNAEHRVSPDDSLEYIGHVEFIELIKTDAPDVYKEKGSGKSVLVNGLSMSREMKSCFEGNDSVTWACTRDARSDRWSPLPGGHRATRVHLSRRSPTSLP